MKSRHASHLRSAALRPTSCSKSGYRKKVPINLISDGVRLVALFVQCIRFFWKGTSGAGLFTWSRITNSCFFNQLIVATLPALESPNERKEWGKIQFLFFLFFSINILNVTIVVCYCDTHTHTQRMLLNNPSDT